jgi:hypothetical protein
MAALDDEVAVVRQHSVDAAERFELGSVGGDDGRHVHQSAEGSDRGGIGEGRARGGDHDRIEHDRHVVTPAEAGAHLRRLLMRLRSGDGFPLSRE